MRTLIKKQSLSLVFRIAAALCLAALMLVSLSCAKAPAGPQNASPEVKDASPSPDDGSERNTEPPAATAVPDNIVYSTSASGVSVPVEVRAGEATLSSDLSSALDSGEYANCLFAVRIKFTAKKYGEASSKLSEIMQSPAVQNRDRIFNEWYAAEADNGLSELEMERGNDAVMVLFEDYWQKNASEADRKAYSEAMEQYNAILDEVCGPEVKAEAERLSGLGLNVFCREGAWIEGFLTADQLRNFPAGDEYGFTISWIFDPALTAEALRTGMERS